MYGLNNIQESMNQVGAGIKLDSLEKNIQEGLKIPEFAVKNSEKLNNFLFSNNFFNGGLENVIKKGLEIGKYIEDRFFPKKQEKNKK